VNTEIKKDEWVSLNIRVIEGKVCLISNIKTDLLIFTKKEAEDLAKALAEYAEQIPETSIQ